MIPLITQTPHLKLIAASRALLIAELQKPQYFPVLLGAALPADWPVGRYDQATAEEHLAQLTAGGRDAAGWYGWFALRKATDGIPTTLVGQASFHGPPDGAGCAEISFSVAEDWRGQGLGTELVAGLVQQAEHTGMVRRLTAFVPSGNLAALQILLHNDFEPLPDSPDTPDGHLGFARAVEPAPAASAPPAA